jgi:hypothetical protein
MRPSQPEALRPMQCYQQHPTNTMHSKEPCIEPTASSPRQDPTHEHPHPTQQVDTPYDVRLSSKMHPTHAAEHQTYSSDSSTTRTHAPDTQFPGLAGEAACNQQAQLIKRQAAPGFRGPSLNPNPQTLNPTSPAPPTCALASS